MHVPTIPRYHNYLHTYLLIYLLIPQEVCSKILYVSFEHATGLSRTFLIINMRFLFSLSLARSAGAHRHSDIRAPHVGRSVPDAHTQQPQTTVPRRPGVHFVGVLDIHSFCVPKDEVHDSRYVPS